MNHDKPESHTSFNERRDTCQAGQPSASPPTNPVSSRWAIAGIGAMALCCAVTLALTAIGAGTGAAAVGAAIGNTMVVVIGVAAGLTAVMLLVPREQVPAVTHPAPSVNELDLVVIGSGGAAMSAAITARKVGAEVVVIENAVIGGTCVNVGCVPSKTLLAAAAARHGALNNPFAGVPTNAGTVDMAALAAQKDELVAGLRQGKYLDVAEAYGFSFMHGTATFDGPDGLSVDGRNVIARAGYVIATGARPAIPDIVGIEEIDYLTSTTAMGQTELPRSLIVIGGGYVGLEQAQLFAHLGSKVTIVGRIAPTAEPELAQVLRTVFADDAIDTVEEHAVRALDEGNDVVVTTSSGRTVRTQRLLVATGRSANTAGLGLDVAEVRLDKNGFVSVDSAQRTSNPRVFAAGDVSGTPQYVYVAAATGAAAAANALGANEEVDYTGMPAIVFTKPQLASAGLTEAQAVANGHNCDSRTLSLQDVPRALVNRDNRGAVKLVIDRHTRHVLGISAAADGAGEMMLAATYAIKAGFTVDQLADTWAPYLTMAESIRLVAQSFRNELPTSCCA